MTDIKKTKPFTRWTKEELAVLGDWSLSNVEVVMALGRNYNAVRAKRQDLPGYHKRSSPQYWTKDQLAMLADKSLSNKAIAKIIGRSAHAVRAMRSRLRKTTDLPIDSK